MKRDMWSIREEVEHDHSDLGLLIFSCFTFGFVIVVALFNL